MMKTLLCIMCSALVAVLFASCTGSRASVTPVSTAHQATVAASPGFYDLTYIAIDGREVSMSSFRGKYILCVNVASECGNTPQYEALQKIYDEHKDKLVIIGFPCNQFGHQEPGNEKEIEDFCKKNYGVTFPLASKIEVKGSGLHPVYAWLTSKELNGVEDSEVKWNFAKYLVSPEGKWLRYFSPGSNPDDVMAWVK